MNSMVEWAAGGSRWKNPFTNKSQFKKEEKMCVWGGGGDYIEKMGGGGVIVPQVIVVSVILLIIPWKMYRGVGWITLKTLGGGD